MGLHLFEMHDMNHFPSLLYRLLPVIGLFLSVTATAMSDKPAALAAPQQQVSLYYFAMSAKNGERLRSLYPDTDRARFSDAYLERRFAALESISVERWLGMETDADLAHVAVSVRVKSADDALPEYGFAHHDLKRIDGQWYFVAADRLTQTEQARVSALWRRHRMRLQTDVELKSHVEWIQDQRHRAMERRRARPVQVVEER